MLVASSPWKATAEGKSTEGKQRTAFCLRQERGRTSRFLLLPEGNVAAWSSASKIRAREVLQGRQRL